MHESRTRAYHHARAGIRIEEGSVGGGSFAHEQIVDGAATHRGDAANECASNDVHAGLAARNLHAHGSE